MHRQRQREIVVPFAGEGSVRRGDVDLVSLFFNPRARRRTCVAIPPWQGRTTSKTRTPLPPLPAVGQYLPALIINVRGRSGDYAPSRCRL